MAMATIQFYKNPYAYPDYKEILTAYGSSMESTPVGINLKSGKLRIRGDMDDFMNCNYIRIIRDGRTVWAWIDNVEYNTENSFLVSYSVDAWRTYKSKINLGNQFIERSEAVTFQSDPLLGSTQPHPNIRSDMYSIGNSLKRYLVVQVRTPEGSPMSRTPISPSYYQFYICEYNVNNWMESTPIVSLMTHLMKSAKPINVVTMYSIPYIDMSTLMTEPLPILKPNGVEDESISGFKLITPASLPNYILNQSTAIVFPYDVQEMLRINHSVQIVIPEAGIMSVPDELLVKNDLMLRQDVDIYSGACNYMLTSGSEKYQHSLRGSSIASIPVISDPLETYLSQNQSALTTSMIGDVASIVGGGATAIYGGPAAGLGVANAVGGINSIINRMADFRDIGNRYTNPPAFLGTALAVNFNQKYWIVTTYQDVDNAADVNAKFGYPQNKFGPLVFPAAGYIKTSDCNVYSTDGSVPRWSIEEINTLFNSGIFVR